MFSRFSALTAIAALILLPCGPTGCDDDDWKTVELHIQSLAASDSVAADESLEVQISYFANGEDQVSSYVFDLVNPGTLQLKVFRRYRENDPLLGAPAQPTTSTVTLESPPSGEFVIVSNGLTLPVYSGTPPAEVNRLTVLVTESGEPLEGVELVLSKSDSQELLTLPPTDAAGRAQLKDGCSTPGARFWIDSNGPDYAVFAISEWPSVCDRPQTVVIPGVGTGTMTER